MSRASCPSWTRSRRCSRRTSSRRAGRACCSAPAGTGCGTERRAPTFIRPHTLHAHLRHALGVVRKQDEKAKRGRALPPLTWYQCTRHTFASLWVMNGGSIEKLSVMMGHSSTVVTQRYAHLRPELFREADYQVLDVDMKPAEVVAIDRANGCATAAQPSGEEERAIVNS